MQKLKKKYNRVLQDLSNEGLTQSCAIYDLQKSVTRVLGVTSRSSIQDNIRTMEAFNLITPTKNSDIWIINGDTK